MKNPTLKDLIEIAKYVRELKSGDKVRFVNSIRDKDSSEITDGNGNEWIIDLVESRIICSLVWGEESMCVTGTYQLTRSRELGLIETRPIGGSSIPAAYVCLPKI